jgi:hypothetical protein
MTEQATEQPEVEVENIGDSDFLKELDALQGQADNFDGKTAEQNETPEQSEQPEFETSKMLYGVISPLFDVFTPNWQVSNNEKMALSQAYGDLIDKYFPDGVHNQFGVEITALTVTGMVFASRIGTPRKLEEKEVNPKKEEQSAPGRKADKKLKIQTAPSDSLPSGAELGAE